MEIPAHFSPLYTADQIAEANRKLGASISVWAKEVWARSHTDILAIPILRGGIFFFADLVRHIESSVEIAPARVWAYEDTAQMRTELKLNIDEVPARGRAVLLVDDICDTGRTLAALTVALKKAGAQDVRSAALVRRELPNVAYVPEWYGLSFSGSDWLVGYGMDDNDRYRNLAGIYTIRQPEPTKE